MVSTLTKIAKFLEFLGPQRTKWCRVGGRRDIFRKANEEYMQRWYLFSSKPFAAYIHRFWESDFPLHHDHPWPSISIVFGAGYKEHLPDGTIQNRGKGHRIRVMSPTDAHWIEIVEPGKCWTVFIRLKKIRDWGFFTKDGWVRHDLYDPELQQVKKIDQTKQ